MYVFNFVLIVFNEFREYTVELNFLKFSMLNFQAFEILNELLYYYEKKKDL